MTLVICDCGAKYDRVASHKKEVLGFQCGCCRRNWRTWSSVNEENQTALWFMYYECTCGSNILNIPPKIQRCVCKWVELR